MKALKALPSRIAAMMRAPVAPVRARALRAGLAAGAVGAALAGVLWFASLQVPSFEEVQRRYVPSEGQLLSSEGEVLQTFRLNKSVQRDAWVPLAEVAPSVKARVLKAEDAAFYDHGAVDWAAVGAAIWANVTFSEGRRGASTLSMQTVDLLGAVRKGRETRSWFSKARQVALAYKLESAWSKEQIFEAYLNEAHFRGELQGIGAVSRFLLSKSPSRVSDEEASLLAVLLRAPSATPARVARRFKQLQEAFGTKQTAGQAEAYVTVTLYRKEGFGQVDEATHLAQRMLSRMPGARSGATTQQIATSLQADLQRAINKHRDERLDELRGRNATDAAVLVLDNKTGQVLAYVGTSGAASKAQEVDTVAALRQAGSTLKPFIYGLAIESNRLTAASLLMDEPLAQVTWAGIYAPQNYDKRFRGLVSVRTALASSMNIPAVKALQIANVDKVSERLRALGIAVPEDADFYGDGLALGSLDVTLLTLTNAFRTLANQGLGADICFERGCTTTGKPVMSPAAAWVIGDILSDNNARSPTFGLNSVLRTPYWSAVKTGTSKDMRDNWAVGYSSRYTVGVWVGNAEGDPMHDVSGVSGAAPLWRDVMDQLHVGALGANPDTKSDQPPAPATVVRNQVSFEPAVEATRFESFVQGTERARVVALVDNDRLVARQVKILNPLAGSRLAVDVGLPADRQRVIFKTDVQHGVLWRLNGTLVTGPSWDPTPGKHVLEALDANNPLTVLDVAAFEVRGSRGESSANR